MIELSTLLKIIVEKLSSIFTKNQVLIWSALGLHTLIFEKFKIRKKIQGTKNSKSTITIRTDGTFSNMFSTLRIIEN